MRILWLAPTYRSSSRIRSDALRNLGAEIMLVTADRGYSEYEDKAEYETILLGRPIPWADWVPCYRTYRAARRFRPDIVVTEYLGDPRWRAFAQLAPRIRLVHDDKPHDKGRGQWLPWWNRMFFERWDTKADSTIVFSRYVANTGLRALGGSRSPIHVAPLHSDLNPALIPDLVPPADRRHFLMFGRQRPYKNHKVIFAAWEAHVSGSAWRGDELVIYGKGDIALPLPPHCRWNRGDFKYRDLLPELSSAKGSIVHHTEGASQSGVQVLSLQLGVPPLVSSGGGLAEYQPDGLTVTGINDVDGLKRAIDALADPEQVARQSRIAREHYRLHLNSNVFARRFLEIAQDLIS